MWLPFLKQIQKNRGWNDESWRFQSLALIFNFCHLSSKRRKVILGGGSTNLSSQESHLQCIKTWEPSMGKWKIATPKLWKMPLFWESVVTFHGNVEPKRNDWFNDWMTDWWMNGLIAKHLRCKIIGIPVWEITVPKTSTLKMRGLWTSSGPVGQWASGAWHEI